MNIIERRGFWARIRDGESTETAPDLVTVATEMVDMLDCVAAWKSNAESAVGVSVDLLGRIDRFAEDAHSAGAERDQAYQAIGRVRDLIDLWEMQGDTETAMTIRKALDGRK